MLHTCYEADWLLFAESDQKTHGRYYFADNAPFYEKGHLLWSDVWLDRNVKHTQALGPVIGGKKIRTDGLWQGVRAFPIAIEPIAGGSIAGGALRPAPFTLLHNNLPDLCYIRPPNPFLDPDQNAPPRPPDIYPDLPSDTDLDRVAALSSCHVQYFYTLAIDRVYYNDKTTLDLLFAALLRDHFDSFLHPHTPGRPGMYLLKHRLFNLAVLDGSIDLNEVGQQVIDGANGPQPSNFVGLMQLYIDASNLLLSRLSLFGADPHKPFLFAGHSFGGSTAWAAAITLRQFDTHLPLFVISFGAPKPGDIRAATVATLISGVAIQATDDVVPLIPPSADDLLGWFSFLAVGPARNSDKFKFLPYRLMLNPSGRTFQPAPDTGFGLKGTVLYNLVNSALAGAVPVWSGHQIRDYARRLHLGCPESCWPFDETVETFVDVNFDYLYQSDGGLTVAGDGDETDGVGGLACGGSSNSYTSVGGVACNSSGQSPVPEGGLFAAGGDVVPVLRGGVNVSGESLTPTLDGGVQIGGGTY